MNQKSVLVGMSGGVDSSVAALLLLRQGYQVAGATFRLWESGDRDIDDAARVCGHLGIPHMVLDLRELFLSTVIMPFCRAYSAGITPNPCVTCNRTVKFGAFWDKAASLGYDSISTGHYARISRDDARGIHRLRKAAYRPKDQSYVLYNLTQERLAATLFPLGELNKEQVREIAGEAGLPVRHKAESQDICFVPDGDYAAFLERFTGRAATPGDFVDPAGAVVGRHLGISRYTIGQRKGLGVSMGRPVFVTDIDAAANRVTLSDDRDLWRRELVAGHVNWVEPVDTSAPLALDAKIRYAQEAVPATVTTREESTVHVAFRQDQRAITPGQSVVFYDGEFVVGGGIIQKTDF